MLFEIICEKFKESDQKITFTPGLNVVLGDDRASNSIGKSTFLMIIDFVFGGDDYINKCDDVGRKIKYHQIKFSFLFNNVVYKFIRDTERPNFVKICDDNYNIQHEISIEEFRDFLKSHYKIISRDLSFREVVSGYYRIYQRKNYDESRPFQFFQNEGMEKSIIRLVKLYDMYESVREYENLVKKTSEILSDYKHSINKGFIPNITKKQYNRNLKQVEQISEDIASIAKDLDKGILDVENFRAKEVCEIKAKLSIVRAKLTKYNNKKDKLLLELSENNTSPKCSSDFYESLKVFFPNVKVQSLAAVDNFHKGLYRILNKEVSGEIDKINNLIDKCNEEISDLMLLLDSYQDEKQFSKIILDKIENSVALKNKLIGENSSYDKLEAYKNDKKESEARLARELSNILLQIQTKINSELENINTRLYSPHKHQAPVLSLLQKSYKYKSFNDNGTGTNFKNLIILDICLLKQTCLPALIHDSMLFKNIGDELLEKIFTQYSAYEKQIFIAFDRLATYSEKIQCMLKDKCVLQLGDEKEALFGFTWGERSNRNEE